MIVHAPDEMGVAAHEAAMFASGLDLLLLAASSPTLDRAKRADALRKALRQWQPLCRAMSKLGMVAPGASTQAEADDGQLRDWIDDRALISRRQEEAG